MPIVTEKSLISSRAREQLSRAFVFHVTIFKLLARAISAQVRSKEKAPQNRIYCTLSVSRTEFPSVQRNSEVTLFFDIESFLSIEWNLKVKFAKVDKYKRGKNKPNRNEDG